MGTAFVSAITLFHSAHIAWPYANSGQALEVEGRQWADIVRRVQAFGLCLHDHQRVVHGNTHQHIVHRFAGLDGATMVVGERIGLSVRNPAFDIKQAVLPNIALTLDLARVQRLASNRICKARRAGFG